MTIYTCGNFNLITPGHCDFFKKSSRLGDVTVFLDSDRRRNFQKPDKQFYNQEERKALLLALSHVYRVFIFDEFEDIEAQVKDDRAKWAKRFKHCPLPYREQFVKGADYKLSTIDDRLRGILDKLEIPITFIPIKEGYSTTGLVERIRNGK